MSSRRKRLIGVLQGNVHEINTGPLKAFREELRDHEDFEVVAIDKPLMQWAKRRQLDCLVVPGGLTKACKKQLGGKNGFLWLKSFVERGGGFVGICAGAAIGFDAGLGAGLVRVRDSVWNDSGWMANLKITRVPSTLRLIGQSEEMVGLTQSDLAETDKDRSDDLPFKGFYNCGPIMMIDKDHTKSKPPLPVVLFRSDIAKKMRKEYDAQVANAIKEAQPNSSVARGEFWTCRVCFKSNPNNSLRCTAPLGVCGKAARDKEFPPEGEMPGKIAVCFTRLGRGTVLLSSVHLEGKNIPERRKWFIDLALHTVRRD